MGVLQTTGLGLVLFQLAGSPGSPQAGATLQPTRQTDSAHQTTVRAYPDGDATPLAQAIEHLLGEPAVATAHWGIAVIAMDGTPIFGLEKEKLFHPASTAKLFTVAAALQLLGPSSTVSTTVSFPPPTADGTVHGDLTLIGRGDPNLSGRRLPWTSTQGNAEATPPPDPLQSFDELATAIAAKGVHRITGDLRVRSGPWEPYPAGWAYEDLLWGYGAPVTALSVNDNQFVLRLTGAAAPGQLAAVSLQPDLGLYRIVSTVNTVKEPSAVREITVHSTPGDHVLKLEGSLLIGKSYATAIAIDDPPRFAGEALRRALTRQGITVQGAVVAPREEPADLNTLHEMRAPLALSPQPVAQGPEPTGTSGDISISHISPPLIEDVTATLKESLNLHAELMLRGLGAAMGNASTAAAGPGVEGARVLHQFLKDAGLDDHEVVLYDGSGLSTKDLVTPRAEAEILAYAARQPWFAQWKAALPLGGVDGTLSARFKEAPLKGHVFAKTGTLGESRALAGYVLCASGREVIFAILDDNHEPGSSADRLTMDKVVAAIAASN